MKLQDKSPKILSETSIYSTIFLLLLCVHKSFSALPLVVLQRRNQVSAQLKLQHRYNLLTAFHAVSWCITRNLKQLQYTSLSVTLCLSLLTQPRHNFIRFNVDFLLPVFYYLARNRLDQNLSKMSSDLHWMGMQPLMPSHDRRSPLAWVSQILETKFNSNLEETRKYMGAKMIFSVLEHPSSESKPWDY